MERLMRRLNGSLSRSVRRSTQDIFQQSPLDLRFALQKTLDPRVTHTRASSATFVDSSGVLRSAVTNLLLRSEEFDNASWTKVRASISANTITAPNGTLTADTGIEDTSSSTTHNPLIQDATIVANGTYTASLYVRAKERSRGAIDFSSTDSANFARGEFNLSTGTITASNGGTGSGVSASISNVGGGWFRVSITGSIGSSLTTGRFVLRMADASGNIAYTGDGTSGIYLWGAQLEQASTVGEYIPTTSAINSAPRFDHNPTTGESLGLLVEEARTNSITNNTMVGAVAGTPGTIPTGWPFQSGGGLGLSVSIVGTGTESGVAYLDWRVSGTASANTSATISFGRGSALTAQTWTSSSYLKLTAGSLSGVTGMTLDLIEETAASTFITGDFISITLPTANSLVTQRRTASRTLTGGATVGLLRTNLSVNVSSGSTVDFTIRIGLPQMEQGAFATSVIPTTSATVTRAADVASITGSNFGVTRTNILSRSEEIGVAPWNLGATTVSPNAIASPTGTLTADSILETSSLLEHNVYPDAIFLSAVQYTFSAYVKANGRSSVGLRHYFAATNWVSRIFSLVGAGSVTQSSAGTTSDVTSVGQSIVNVGNDWYRLSLTFTSPTARGAYVSIDGCTTTTPTLSAASGTEIYTGDVTKGYYMWGAQLETGPTATAYIPTTTAAVSVFESSFYNQTEGTVFAEANSPTGGTDVTFDDGTVNTNRVVLYYQAVTDPRLFVASAGATSCIISAGTITSNSRARLVGAYKLNDFAASVNGASPALDASGDAPTGVDRARIGRSSADGGYLNGCLRRLTYWPTRLGNEVLQRITQP